MTNLFYFHNSKPETILAIFNFFSYYSCLDQPLNFRTLNTKEFIQALAEKLNVSHKESAKLLQQTTRTIREVALEEKKITLLHLGSFQVKKSASRTAYLPALKKKALIPPRRVVRFHPAASLKETFKNTAKL